MSCNSGSNPNCNCNICKLKSNCPACNSRSNCDACSSNCNCRVCNPRPKSKDTPSWCNKIVIKRPTTVCCPPQPCKIVRCPPECVGPTGPRGPMGPRGLRGPKGQTGPH